MPKIIGMALVYKTTDALGADASVTSGRIRTVYAEKVLGTVYADVDGTLYIEWSSDGGNNWDGQDTISVTGGTPTSINVDVKAPDMRVRYVNGAAAQTEFRLYVFIK